MALASYRSPDLTARVAELVAQRAERVARIPTAACKVYERRVAAIASGAAGTIGGVVMLALGYVSAADDGIGRASPYGVAAVAALACSWLAMGIAYLVGRAVASARVTRSLDPEVGGDERAYVARLVDEHPALIVAQRAARLETASVALPLSALALLAPLSLHWFVGSIVGMHALSADDFSRWLTLSVLLVGHAHLVAAGGAIWFARHVRRVDPAKAGAVAPAFIVLSLAATAGALPGAVLLMIPPILVFVTGVLFMPVAYAHTFARVTGDRIALAAAREPHFV